MRVLFFDKSDPVIFEWAKYYAENVCTENTQVILWSYWRKSQNFGRLEVKNYADYDKTLTVSEIEKRIETPIWTSLACERSFFDFSYHTNFYSYSRMNSKERNQLINDVIQSLWTAVSETDLIIEGLKDNFIAAIALPIGFHLKKKIKMIRLWSIWKDSLHLVNMPNQISSEINEAYFYFLNKMKVEDYYSMVEKVKKEIFSPQIINIGLLERLNLIYHKYRSYEKISIRNLIARKFRRVYGRSLAYFNIKLIEYEKISNPFVVYALHVMPEASILGSNPDMAYQFDIIRRLSLGMPWGVSLICKIHPGDIIGKDLDYDFIKKIDSLPNVKIVRTQTKIKDLFSSPNFLALATINGTIGIDGMLAGKPVMLFGDTIFSISDYFIKPKSVQDIWDACQEILSNRFELNLISAAAILQALDTTRLTGSIDSSKPEKWLDLYKKTLHILEYSKSEYQLLHSGNS